MNCRELEEQFEDGLNLSEQAKVHLKACGDCKMFQSENLQLSQMISSLPKIEAPKDFEFGLKAKLAQSKLKKPLTPFWQTLRYLLPLTAAALIFGFIVVNSSLFAPTKAPQVADKKNAVEQKEIPANELSFDQTPEVSDELATENSEKPNEASLSEKVENLQIAQEKQFAPEITENIPKILKKKDSGEDEILSKDIRPEKDSTKLLDRDSALTKPEEINPPGIDPDKKIIPQITEPATSFTAKEVLSQLGIETSNENGRLKVSTIRQNSAGANSGVKVGDIVTAIDGQELTSTPLQNRTVQGKTLKVQRDNKELNITIRNN